MSNSMGEIYFIVGMMVVILAICIAATYLFFRTYYREKEAAEAEAKRNESPSEKSGV